MMFPYEEFLTSAESQDYPSRRRKCEIGATELKFLGEIVSKEGMKPDPQKVTAITQMTPPSNREELARFLGMIKYLARFLPELSERSYHLRV